MKGRIILSWGDRVREDIPEEMTFEAEITVTLIQKCGNHGSAGLNDFPKITQLLKEDQGLLTPSLVPLPLHQGCPGCGTGWWWEEELSGGSRGWGLELVRGGTNQPFCPDHSRRKLKQGSLHASSGGSLLYGMKACITLPCLKLLHKGRWSLFYYQQ